MLVKKGFMVSAVDRIADLTEFKPGTVVENIDMDPSLRVIKKGEVVKNKDGWNKVHLYLFVKEDVLRGEFLLADEHSKSLITEATKDLEDQMHLVATTNPEFVCARIPKWFIKDYVEKNINDVAVQYEATTERLVPKKNKEHYIQLGVFQEYYDLEDVSRIILTMVEHVYVNHNREAVTKWINENLS